MTGPVRPVLFIDLCELLSRDKFQEFIDTMHEVGSPLCQFRKECGKHWSEGFSFAFYMLADDGEVHHNYNGAGTLTFNDRDYKAGYKTAYDILIEAGLTQEQLFDEFVLNFDW